MFLLFTILFSASVFADCCNFEVETSMEQVERVDVDHKDCETQDSHSAAEHCHCSPQNHFKIFPQDNIVISFPFSFSSSLIISSEISLESTFESFIFHPPIV